MELTARHTLPSGGWVEIRDANYLRARDRRALMRKITPDNAAELPKIEMGLLTLAEIQAMMIVAWELPYEPEPHDDGTPRPWTLPSNDITILDELLSADSAELDRLMEPAQRVLMPQKPSPDGVGDPASPSGPESA